MTTELVWTEHAGIPGIQCPLSGAGDYVISHRPEQFALSYRPNRHHVPLGKFSTEHEAKDTAQRHANFEIVNCLGEARVPDRIYPDGSYSCPYCWAAVTAGSPAWLARKCPSPACFARHSPPFPVDVAREMVAKSEERKREEQERRELHASRMQLAEEARQARADRDTAIVAEARSRGACIRCALASGRYPGASPKYTKHRNACPKEKRR